MISKATSSKPQAKPRPLSGASSNRPAPYIVPRVPAVRRVPLQRQSIIQTRTHRGLRLISTSPPTKRRSFWSGWMDRKHLHQSHLDRAFLVLAASSALLLLLISR
jgi:hypothetical protein